MSLSLILTSSSFFFSDYIESKINSDKISQRELSLAITRDVSVAIYQARKNAEQGSLEWLSYSRRLAKFDDNIALQLANYFYQEQNKVKALFWWRHAAKLGNASANINLMHYYLSVAQLDEALKIIKSVPQSDHAIFYQIQIALIEGNVTEALSLTRELKEPNHRIKLERIFKRYKIDDKWKLDKRGVSEKRISTSYQMMNLASHIDFPLLSEYSIQCRNSVQVFATNFSDLLYSEKLIQQVQKSIIGAKFCFAPVRYIPLSQLGCQHKLDQAAQCDELVLSKLTDIGTRYISILLPNGGAKVDHGIMYIDRSDTADVFEHELAHWLGFIDEYPLPDNHLRCGQKQKEPFSHNVAVLSQDQANLTREQLLRQLPWSSFIKNTTPLKTKTDTGWKLGTPIKYRKQIGLFPAKTCNGNQVQSFKPVAHRTKLQYFELAFPVVYSAFLERAERDFTMPSYHYNFALASNLKGQDMSTKMWLKKAATMESSPYRKKIIKKGGF